MQPSPCWFKLNVEYTPIVTQLSYMKTLSQIEFQNAFLTFESRIEQLNALQNLSISLAANLTQAQKNFNTFSDTKTNNRGNQRGGSFKGINNQGRGK